MNAAAWVIEQLAHSWRVTSPYPWVALSAIAWRMGFESLDRLYATPGSFPRRARGSFLAWRRAHLPRLDAFMRGDDETWRRLSDLELAREEMFRERFVYCICCRALMIHAALGHFYCPYQRAGVHEHARRAAR
jgi:hypothetical protein